MSEPSPNPAENPDIPPAPPSTPGRADRTGPPAAEPPADTPIAEGPAGSPATEEPASEPPQAELLVTPAVRYPVDSLLREEPADAPIAEGPADAPGWGDPSQAPLTEGPADAPPAQPWPGPALGDEQPGEPAAQEPVWAGLARRPAPGQSVVMIAGVLLFIWGFLPWYSDAGGSANAWSTITIPGLLLTATWVPLLSLAIAVFLAIKVFADGLPDKILGFSWAQLSMVAGLFDFLISLGFLVANRSLGNLGSLDLGPGLILSFITSIAMLAGALFDHLGMSEVRTRVPPGAGANPPRRASSGKDG